MLSYSFDFSFFLTAWPAFMRGAWQTILLAGSSIAIGFVLALVCAIIRSSKSSSPKWTGRRECRRRRAKSTAAEW